MRENNKKQETGKKPRLFSMLGNSMEEEMALKQWKSVIRQMSIDGQWFKMMVVFFQPSLKMSIKPPTWP